MQTRIASEGGISSLAYASGLYEKCQPKRERCDDSAKIGRAFGDSAHDGSPCLCAVRQECPMSGHASGTSPGNSSVSPAANPLRRSIQVIVVSSVMFTFISYWRTAAVVLCDLASTAYYIGGIVEGAIGPAAPWFILAVMLFSYCVRSIYIESCSLFVRGGVYRVVKEAMGGFLAKLSVSALMFDYILTGPISGVSAGQYIMGLVIATVRYRFPDFLMAGNSADRFHELGLGLHRRGDYALLLPPEHHRHSRVERQSPEDHDRHDRHGRRDFRLVRHHARRSRRTGQSRSHHARPQPEDRLRHGIANRPVHGRPGRRDVETQPQMGSQGCLGRQPGDRRVHPSISGTEGRRGQTDQGRQRQTTAKTGRQRQTDSRRSEEQHHRRSKTRWG